jgi:hypothetical protein
VFEHLRPQLARDPPHLIQRPANSLLRLVDLLAFSGPGSSNRIEVQEHTSQQLTNLVVQVTGDSNPLGFLGCEHAPAALLALILEPFEHLVEGAHHASHFVVAGDLEPLAGVQ